MPDQRFREKFQNEPIRSPLEYEQREAARRTQADMEKLLREKVGELEARLHEPCRAEIDRLKTRIAELEAEIDRLKQLLEEFSEDEVPEEQFQANDPAAHLAGISPARLFEEAARLKENILRPYTERIAELETGIVWLCDHFVSWQEYSDRLAVEDARTLPTTLEGVVSAAKDEEEADA